MRSEVLYVLVRADLPPGLQLAQVGHGCAEWAMSHPEAAHDWRVLSNSIVVLAVPDEDALHMVVQRWCDADPASSDLAWRLIREPDLDDQATCAVFSPSEWCAKEFASLPLALREVAVT